MIDCLVVNEWDRIDEDYFYQKWLEDSKKYKEYISSIDC